MPHVGIWISGYGSSMHKSTVIKYFYFILFLFFALVLHKPSKMVKYVRLGLTGSFTLFLFSCSLLRKRQFFHSHRAQVTIDSLFVMVLFSLECHVKWTRWVKWLSNLVSGWYLISPLHFNCLWVQEMHMFVSFCFSFTQRNLFLILQLYFIWSFKLSLFIKCIHLYLKMPIFSCLKPMALEQVLSDRDSEDEVDDDVADFEDRRV